MSVLSHIIPPAFRKQRDNKRAFADWRRNAFSVPLPDDAKRAVLLRYGLPSGTWVETGTYLGDTTAVLAKHASRVVTLEPAPTLYEAARGRFATFANVEVLNATSEEAFPSLLPTLSGPVSFWLDGHYSGGSTFQGSTDCPLRSELDGIADNLSRYDNVAVLVDDIRLCGPQSVSDYTGYPSLDELVDWARANGLAWLIEHDIFVARKRF